MELPGAGGRDGEVPRSSEGAGEMGTRSGVGTGAVARVGLVGKLVGWEVGGGTGAVAIVTVSPFCPVSVGGRVVLVEDGEKRLARVLEVLAITLFTVVLMPRATDSTPLFTALWKERARESRPRVKFPAREEKMEAT